MMQPDALRKLREDRDMTRKDFALWLAPSGGCSEFAVVKWERGENPIPEWVEEKCLRAIGQMELNLPLGALKELVDCAIAEGKPFESIMAQALKDYLTRRRATFATTAAAASVLNDQPGQSSSPPPEQKPVNYKDAVHKPRKGQSPPNREG